MFDMTARANPNGIRPSFKPIGNLLRHISLPFIGIATVIEIGLGFRTFTAAALAEADAPVLGSIVSPVRTPPVSLFKPRLRSVWRPWCAVSELQRAVSFLSFGAAPFLFFGSFDAAAVGVSVFVGIGFLTHVILSC